MDADFSETGHSPDGTPATDSIVLEEEIDPNYVPSDEEVVEYAKWLGMDLDKDKDLYWVAREGLMAPLPKNWKPCKTKDTEDIYYFNFSSGESTWDHPCDGYYKSLYEEEKKKKEISMKERNDQQRSKAKQDVEELLGKGEKKKKKGTSSLCDLSSSSMKLPSGPLGLTKLERKPLPGIMLQGVLGSLQGLSKSWTGANVNVVPTLLGKDGDKEKEKERGRKEKEKDKDVENSQRERDRSAGSHRGDSTPLSAAVDTVDGKTRRRQRDSSSPSIGREPIHMSAVPLPLSHDANRRVGVTAATATDQSRRNSISDKGRLGEEGPYKDGEFVVYSSGTDSGSEGAGVGSPSRAPVSRNVLSATSKAVPLSSRRASDDFKARSHMEEDMSCRSDRVKDREMEKEKEKEKEKEHESNADGWERDGKGWVPKDQNQEGARSKASASSSSMGGSQGQGKSEKHNCDATNNDEVRNFSDDDPSVGAYSNNRRSSFSKSDKEVQREKDRGINAREEEGGRGIDRERERERYEEGGGEGKDERGPILRKFDITVKTTPRDWDNSTAAPAHQTSGTGTGAGAGRGSLSTFSDVGGISLSVGSAGSGLSHTAAAAASKRDKDHQNDMSARRKSWQQEVDSHEESLGLQRAVMIKEKRKLDDEQDLLRKKQSTEDSGDYGSAAYSVSVISPMNAVADLRSKLRELESEMDEMRIQGKAAEQDNIDLQRSLSREKEGALRALTESGAVEEKLTKQLKSARALNSTLEEERIKLQTDLSAARSELKRKTSDKIPDKGPESATKHAPLGGDHLGLIAGSEEKEEDSKGLLIKIKNLERSLEQEIHSKAALSQLMEAAQSAHEKNLTALRKQLDHTKYNLDALRTFSEKPTMSEGSKAKNDIQNRTELDELSSIIERKKEELDILSRKCSSAESEVDSLKGSYTAMTALSDQRVGQLEGEKQTLTARLASEVGKVSSMREQVRVLEEQVADKEVQYQQTKQASAALQRVNDQANIKAQSQSQSRILPQTERDRKENVDVDEDGDVDNDGYGELHTLRKQASLDEVHRAHEKEIRILTNKILLAQDAAASAQSLLLSSKGSGNHEEEYSDLVVKYNNLSSELSSEKFSGAAKDVKISLLQDEKEKLKSHAGNVEMLQVKIMKVEQEIVRSNSLLLTKETELLYLNGQIENSDSSTKKTILELNQLNSSLSERMALAAARVKDLSNQIKNLVEEKFTIENQYEESSKLCEELKIELNNERKKSPKVNQLEVERDTLLKTVSHSGTTIRDLEKKISSVTAEFEIMKSAFLGTERGPAALDAKEKQVALMMKVDQLTVKSAELLASHSLLNEKDRTQSSAFAALQAKHKSCLEELEAAAVRHRVTSSEAAEVKNKEHSALQNIINNERNQHQKVLSSLHEVLKGKEKEITALKANKVEHEHRNSTSVSSPSAPFVSPPPPPPMIQPPPPPLHLGEGSAGFAALSVIVGQQQTSVQRLTEKLESAESLIFALTQALPGTKLTQDPDSYRSPARGMGATSSVNSHRMEGIARVEAESDADSGGGESERKATASTADHYKFNKMHSPAFTSPDNDKRKGQKEKERERERASKIEIDRINERERGIEREGGTELEKDLLLTPDQTSMSENENKLKEATRQWKTFINPAIAESWSKVPSKHDPQPHTKSPMRSRPQRMKEKEKEKEKERPGSELGLEMWALKVARENRFLEDLTATLKEEKLSVRREQENLGRRRAKWRVKKASNPGDTLGKMELREESAELNTHTTRLNAAVEQTRVMQGFLIERRRKLDALKDSLQQLSDCRDALGVSTRIKGSSAHPRTDDADLTLEAMHRLGRELDSEVEVTLHQFNCASSADETSGRARGRPSSSSYPPTGDTDYVRYPRSNHDGKPVSQDGLYQQSNQHQSTKPRSKQQQQQSSSGHPQQNQSHSHGMRGFYSPQGPGPNPGPFDPRMYPFGYDQGPPYPMQPQTGPAYSIPDNAFVQLQGQQQQQDIGREGYYIPPHSSSPPRSHEDPGRWTLPPSTIRFNLGVQGLPGDFPSSSSSSMYTYPYTDLRHSTPHTDRAAVRDPRAIREQIKDLTKRRAQSTEAYDTHASWLNNLQAEIGQFSHGSGARARASAVRREDNIPSFTDFMASQCPPVSLGEKHLAVAAAEIENEAKKL